MKKRMLSLTALILSVSFTSQAQETIEQPKHAVSVGINYAPSFKTFSENSKGINIYYAHQLNRKSLFFALSYSNSYDRLNATIANKKNEISTNYPGFITRPDSIGNFVGLSSNNTISDRIGINLGIEKYSPISSKLDLIYRAGIGFSYEKKLSYQTINFYSIDYKDSVYQIAPYFTTYKGEELNSQITNSSHLNFSLLASVGLRYNINNQWKIWTYVNLNPGFNMAIESKSSMENDTYSESFCADCSAINEINLNYNFELGLSYSF